MPKHEDSRPTRVETEISDETFKPRAVKVSGETYAQLYRFMGALQMEYGEKVSANEAIAMLLERGQDVLRVIEGKNEPHYTPQVSGGAYIVGVSERQKPHRITRVDKLQKKKATESALSKMFQAQNGEQENQPK